VEELRSLLKSSRKLTGTFYENRGPKRFIEYTCRDFWKYYSNEDEGHSVDFGLELIKYHIALDAYHRPGRPVLL
jgi:hypothetical protein